MAINWGQPPKKLAILIRRNETRLILKFARNAPGVGMAPSGLRGHKNCAQMLIQFVVGRTIFVPIENWSGLF